MIVLIYIPTSHRVPFLHVFPVPLNLLSFGEEEFLLEGDDLTVAFIHMSLAV